MSKNVLVVRCDKDIMFDEWNAICHYIQQQVIDEYHVIGLIKGINIECITEDDKVFFIDGDNYSYKNIKEAIENNKKPIEEKVEETEEQEETSQEENIEKEKVE